MSVQINYDLQSNARSEAAARRLVAKLRDHAIKLSFHQVDEIVEFSGKNAFFGTHSPLCRHFWLLVQSGEWLIHDETVDRIAPDEIIAFSTQPGPDSEQANFGLCLYPATCVFNDQILGEQQIPTDLDGWRWSAFIETDRGGINEEFLRCHMLIVSLLDRADDMGILENVEDEGQFWERRDPHLLAKRAIELREPGDHKTEVGEPTEILRFPDFDRLMSEFGEGK